MTKKRENILITTLVSLGLLCMIYLAQSDPITDTASFLPLDKLVIEHTSDPLDVNGFDLLKGVKKIVSIAINKS